MLGKFNSPHRDRILPWLVTALVVARRYRVSHRTVSLWRKRYADQGIPTRHHDAVRGARRGQRHRGHAVQAQASSSGIPGVP